MANRRQFPSFSKTSTSSIVPIRPTVSDEISVLVNMASNIIQLSLRIKTRFASVGMSTSKSNQNCSDAATASGAHPLKSPDGASHPLQLLSPGAARARHISSTSSASATSGESAIRGGERGGGGGGGTHLIKHRKFLGGGASRGTDKSRDNQASVVLVGYKHKPTTEGRREVAVGTLVDAHGNLGSGVGGNQSTSTSGISSSSNDLDVGGDELARETPHSDETPNGRPSSIHSSGSMPYLTHLNHAVANPALTTDTLFNPAADAAYILHQHQQQHRLQQQHLFLQQQEDPSLLSHVLDDPTAAAASNLAMQSSMSGSLPDLASQEVVIDFPPQMTKSQQLMDQFQADSANNILEAVDGLGHLSDAPPPGEEKVSVYDILVETMQVGCVGV